jgi:hypothetical protein
VKQPAAQRHAAASSPRPIPGGGGWQAKRMRNDSSLNASPPSSPSAALAPPMTFSPPPTPGNVTPPRMGAAAQRATYSPSRFSPTNFASSSCYTPPSPSSLPKPPTHWIGRCDLPIRDPSKELKSLLNVFA